MRHGIALFTLAALLVGAAPAAAGPPTGDAAASDDTEFRQDIRRLMDLTGAGDLGMQVIQQMVAMFRQSYAGVPPQFWDEFVASVDKDELVELVVPIYEKHFTHDDVKGLIEFYTTPLGQKVLSAQPKIVEESMLAGQLWGAQIGAAVEEKLREEGYR